MATGKWISYLRVSTARQGRSGLGLEAQRDAVAGFLNGGSWSLIAEVVEVESGKRSDRPKLAEALRLCRMHGATLVIAKLDRLARDVAFIAPLMKTGVDFVAVDFPQANRLTIHILAAVAEHEAEAASTRTKDALARAKARGTKLGGDRGNIRQIAAKGRQIAAMVRSKAADMKAQDVAATIAEIDATGSMPLRQIAAALDARAIPAPRGGSWSSVQVARIRERMARGGTAI
jgi:DNA invertase Pin-like site-specific DNA recombinase